MTKAPPKRVVYGCCYADPERPDVDGRVLPERFLTEPEAMRMATELASAGFVVGVWWCREVKRHGRWEIDFDGPPPGFFDQ